MAWPAASSPIRLHNSALPPNRAIATAALAAMPYELPGGQINLLVLGGSLGARVFSDVVPAALAAGGKIGLQS